MLWICQERQLKVHLDTGYGRENTGRKTEYPGKRKEEIQEKLDILKEALSEFCVDSDTLADHFMNEDWEYFDVTIRCYLLGSAISAGLIEHAGWRIAADFDRRSRGLA